MQLSKRKNDDLKKAIKILGLSQPFSLLDIKEALKKRAKDLHPDRHPAGLKAEIGMKEVNWAYHVLLNRFEQVKIPLSLLVSSAQTEEERLKERFYYDWMPPKHKGDETV